MVQPRPARVGPYVYPAHARRLARLRRQLDHQLLRLRNRRAVSLLTYAKQLFNVPVALGQAAGAASLPFLASLFVKPDRVPFSRTVNAAVSKILAFSILLTGYLIAMAYPAVDVVFRGGKFHRADSGTMAVYFADFAISLCLWSAQAIYARAFYAAGNTLTPMIAGTIVTAVSLP
ncbi:MAG: lipid II flippase MurJ, partial [Acidobacteriaceae bacterium]